MTLLAASAIWLILLVGQSTSVRILLALPATALHELAHWSVAFVTGSRPSLPSLWPRKEGQTWVLGSVTFQPGAWSAGWVALAPAWLLGSASYWALALRNPSAAWTDDFFIGIAAGYGAWGACPSLTDVEVALRYPLGTMVVCTLFLAGWSLHLSSVMV